MKIKKTDANIFGKPNGINRSRISLAAVFFLYGTVFAAWAVRIPDIKISHHLNDPQLGAVLLAMPVGTVVSLLISGKIISRHSIKLIILGSFVLLNVSLLGLGVPGSKYLLVFSLFLFGFFGNALNVAINTQALYIQKKIGKTIMSSFHAVYSIGFMLSVAFGGIMSKQDFLPFSHFAILLGANIVMVILASGYLLDSEKKSENSSRNLAIITSDKNLWILGFIVFCGVLSEGTLIDWAAVYFRQYINSSAQYSAIALSFFSIAMTLGRFSGDYLVNRFRPATILSMSGIGLSLGMVLSLSTVNPLLVTLGYIICGLSISNMVPITYTFTSQLSDQDTALAISTIATIGYVGILLGPALIGFLSGIITLRGALFTLAILGSIVFVLTKYIERRIKYINNKKKYSYEN